MEKGDNAKAWTNTETETKSEAEAEAQTQVVTQTVAELDPRKRIVENRKKSEANIVER